MFHAEAIAVMPPAVDEFDVVEMQIPANGGEPVKATFVNQLEGVVTLQASPALMAKGNVVAMERLASKEATDFAIAVAKRLGLHDPSPQLSDTPYAVDANGKILVTVGKIAAYRIEIRLNASRG